MSFELNKKLAERRPPLKTPVNIDPVTASIIRGAMETVCYEMATHLGRAASSPIINQSNERTGSVIDAHGRLAAVSVGLPYLTFVSQHPIRYGLMMYNEFDWGPGDVFICNDPDYGGGHLPDFMVYAPVYDDKGELILVTCLQAHHADTGGKDPGGFTLDATDIFTEGLAIPCLKLVHRGVKRNDTLNLIARNNRFPTFAGDIAAKIGGVEHGVRELQALARKWGTDTVKAAVNYNIDHSERRFREEIAKWPDGVYQGDALIDHDTQGTKDVKVHVTCTVKGDQLTVDLTGTDDRKNLVGVWNTFGNTRSYIMTQLAASVDPAVIKNEGMFNAIEMVIPENTIVHPPPNMPAALGSFHPASEICEVICLALAKVVPERAAFQGYKVGMPTAVFGFVNGRMWYDQGTDTKAMDSSGVKGLDGWGAGPAALGNLLFAQAEDAEPSFPVINIGREMQIDQGGPGQWRGQPGTLNSKRVLKPATAIAWVVSREHPLRGVEGGDDASGYHNWFFVGAPEEFEAENTAHVTLKPGDVVAYQQGGGSGFGPAIKRDPQMVREDVLDEYVSLKHARERYGVVLKGSLENYDLEVDVAATDSLRRDMAQAQARKIAAE